MEITTRTFSFTSRWDGVRIHGICMIPEKPIGIFQMVHGMCEHKERYLSFMESMAQRGYVTLMHDNRGHGMSVKEEGDIGYCYESMEKGFIEDIYQVTKNIRREYPDLPLILYGHSMGSLAVRSYLRKHDDAIDGLVISGCPGYNEAVPLGKLMVAFMTAVHGERYRSSLVQKMVLGSFERRFWREKRKNAWLAAKESVAEAFEQDELCTFTYTLNGFRTLLNLESQTYRGKGYQVKNSNLPILFLSGEDDPCYINERKWYQAIYRMHDLGYEQTTSIRYKGMRHEIHNEEDNVLVYEEIDAFCRDFCIAF